METAPHRPASYLISIWVDHHAGDLPVWRGALVTPADQHLYFSTLAELARRLCELTGWQDPPPDDTAAEVGRG